MKAVKGVCENGEVRLLENMTRKKRTDVMVIFSRETNRTERQRETRAGALLKELDAIADNIEGEFDSAADIRQVRRKGRRSVKELCIDASVVVKLVLKGETHRAAGRRLLRDCLASSISLSV